MNIIASPNLSSVLSRAFETMWEGSEKARIRFDMEEGIYLQSIDSLSVCACRFHIPKNRFDGFIMKETSFWRRVDLRKICEFIRLQPHGHFSFAQTNNMLHFIHHLGTTVAYIDLEPDSDTSTIYYDMNLDLRGCPSFQLYPEEFSNMILNLCVGGGYTNFEFNTGLKLHTTFELGTISFSTEKEGDHFKILEKGCCSNAYLTKFLKQAAFMACHCTKMTLYMSQDGPLILHLTLEDNISTLCVIITPKE